MAITKVTSWFLRTHPSLAHGSRPCLGGEANGRPICTSPIVEVHGRTVTTESGSLYRLEGTPDTVFLHALENRKMRFLVSAPLRPLDQAGDFVHTGPRA